MTANATKLCAPALIALIIAVFAVPASASVKAGSQTYAQTFPVAVALCNKVAAGTERKHLQPFATQLTADCTALQTAFTGAQTAVLAVRTADEPTIASDRAAVHVACPTPKSAAAICHTTQKTTIANIVALRHTIRAAAKTYYNSVEAARKAFWTAVKSLPGEHKVAADKPIPNPIK